MQITADCFLDAMTLLINDNSQKNQNAVKELIQIFRNEESKGTRSDKDLTEFYVSVLQDIMATGATKKNKDALNSILLRFRSNKAFSEFRNVMELLEEIFNSPQETDEQIQQAAVALDSAGKRIQRTLLWHKAHQKLRKAYGQLNRVAEIQDPDVQYSELESLEGSVASISELFKEAREDSSGKDLVDCIDLKDLVSVESGLKKHTKRNIAGRIKTPFQGLNLGLGRAEGIVRGESVIFNALPHNYKSGILLDIAVGAVIHNTYTVEPGKKPLVLYITLENEAYENLMLIYKQRYRQETGKDPNLLTDDEIKVWITDFFNQFDTDFKVERHLPHNFGYEEFVARCNHYASQGYEIIACIVDYLHNMKRSSGPGASNAGRDVAVRELYNKMCNYTKNALISLISAHPLNRRCGDMVKLNQNAVKKMGIEHLADSIDPEREVDVSIYMNKEKNVQGRVFLTFNVAKHRYVNDTPEAHKYFAYPFPLEGVGIHDDIGQAPNYTRDIYSWGMDDEDEFSASATGEEKKAMEFADAF